MIKPCAWIFLLMAIGMTVSCAGHIVRIKGTETHPGSEPITPGAKIYLFESNKMDVGLKHRMTLYATVKHLLEERGYVISDIRNADYFVLLSYGVGTAREIRVEIPVTTSYATFAPIINHFEGGPAPTVQPVSPPVVMGKTVRRAYDLWLACKAIDGREYWKSKTLVDVWNGQARMDDSQGSTLGNALNIMLPALMERFGETVDTEQVVRFKDLILSSSP
jgi:hypothetical protein